MSNLPIRPMLGRLLVKPHEDEPKSLGGIYIGEKAAERSTHRHGVVLAIGRDCKADVNLADEIIFSRPNAPEVTVKGVKYCIVPDDAVIGVVIHDIE